MEYKLAQLKAKLVLVNLLFRYYFTDASQETVTYDPKFFVIRPVNVYVQAMKRASWLYKKT